MVTLGEGGTPLLPARKIAQKLGMRHLYIKDEGNGGGGLAGQGVGDWAALKRLLAAGIVTPETMVVLLNTDSGLKYLELVK